MLCVLGMQGDRSPSVNINTVRCDYLTHSSGPLSRRVNLGSHSPAYKTRVALELFQYLKSRYILRNIRNIQTSPNTNQPTMPRFWYAWKCEHTLGCDPLFGDEAHLEPGNIFTSDVDVAYCPKCIREGPAMADLEHSMAGVQVKDVYVAPTSKDYDIVGDMAKLKMNHQSATVHKPVSDIENFQIQFAVTLPTIGEISKIFKSGVYLPWGSQTVPYDVPYRGLLLLPGGLKAFADGNSKHGKNAANPKMLLSDDDLRSESVRLMKAGINFEDEQERTKDAEGAKAYKLFFDKEAKRLGLDGDEAITMMGWRMKVAWKAFLKTCEGSSHTTAVT